MKRDLRVYDNIVDAIGQTPMVKLRRIPKANDVACQIYCKCDHLNPGGSIKDRIGNFMIEAAEKEGRLKPGDTIVESTSGNTGIGLALVAAIKGYKLIITIPDKMSLEKINTLKALGAKVIVTPTDRDHDHPESYTSVAKRLGTQPNHFWVDQYANHANVDAHYKTTSLEIWDQMEKKINYIFISVGTGGTVIGIAKRMKELDPNIKIIGVDPEGSILAQPESLNKEKKMYKIEGIGQSKVPEIMDRSMVHEWVKINDSESFVMARELIKSEGLLVGGSCGSALVGAFKYLKEKNLHTQKDLRCVVILPDSVRNYMTKFLVDEWMLGNEYWQVSNLTKPEKDHFNGKTIKDFPEVFKPLPYLDKRLTVGDCFDLFKKGLHILPIQQAGQIIGVVTNNSLIKAITTQNLGRGGSCSNFMTRDFLKLPVDTPLCIVQQCLQGNYHVLLVEQGKEASQVFAATQAEITLILENELKELI